MARLKDKYFKEIVPELKKEFGYRNVMEVPRVTKVTLNMGVGEAKTNAKLLDDAVEELALISRPAPGDHQGAPSIAGFKLREGMSIGCRVTLRGERMYEMIDRLVSIALPRIRDFRGIAPDSVRRPWQLRHGRARADDLPRDRLRLGGARSAVSTS